MIGSSSARTKERLTDGDVIVVEVIREPLLGHTDSSYGPGDPSSSAAVRVVLVHNIKEEEGERQKEVQEAKGYEEKESEVDGEAGSESHSTCA